MKSALSVLLAAVILFSCTVFVRAEDARVTQEECPCACHLMLEMRDTLLQRIAEKSIDCKTLSRILFYYVQLFTWRVLNVRQYCVCGARHY